MLGDCNVQRNNTVRIYYLRFHNWHGSMGYSSLGNPHRSLAPRRCPLSGSPIAEHRKHDVEWLFPQEKTRLEETRLGRCCADSARAGRRMAAQWPHVRVHGTMKYHGEAVKAPGEGPTPTIRSGPGPTNRQGAPVRRAAQSLCQAARRAPRSPGDSCPASRPGSHPTGRAASHAPPDRRHSGADAHSRADRRTPAAGGACPRASRRV